MKNFKETMCFENMDDAEINELREERADEIAELIDGDDFQAKVWVGGSSIRVYVKRELARGRVQDCGDIEITEDGSIEGHITRARSTIMDLLLGRAY